MSELKCPFCQQEMICGGTICHYNPDCPIHDHFVPTELLELLERTRKALDFAKDVLKLFCGEDVSYYSQSKIDARDAHTALEQITALEQKGE